MKFEAFHREIQIMIEVEEAENKARETLGIPPVAADQVFRRAAEAELNGEWDGRYDPDEPRTEQEQANYEALAPIREEFDARPIDLERERKLAAARDRKLTPEEESEFLEKYRKRLQDEREDYLC